MEWSAPNRAKKASKLVIEDIAVMIFLARKESWDVGTSEALINKILANVGHVTGLDIANWATATLLLATRSSISARSFQYS